jgi:hypothetical protein
MIAYAQSQPDFYTYTKIVDVSTRLSTSAGEAVGMLPSKYLSFRSIVPLGRVTVGASCRYTLKRQIDLTILYHGNPRFECYTEEFGSTIIGYGTTKSESQQDWEDQFHLRFQELYQMLSFEMILEQKELWGKFERLVDLTAYRNEQPVVVSQIGQIIRMRTSPILIQWINGEREDVPPNQSIPPEFVSYKCGQFFEAVVERDFQTGHIRRIVHSKLLPNFKIHNAPELIDFLSSLPSSKNLPATTF